VLESTQEVAIEGTDLFLSKAYECLFTAHLFKTMKMKTVLFYFCYFYFLIFEICLNIVLKL